MVDVDLFKHVNDRYGHAVGDEVLCEVARRMQQAVRPYDRVGRFGGEEFLVLVPGVTAPELEQLLERLRVAVGSSPFTAEGHAFPVTVSAGGAVSGGEPADALVARADAALYVAKARGRDRVVLAGAPPPS